MIQYFLKNRKQKRKKWNSEKTQKWAEKTQNFNFCFSFIDFPLLKAKQWRFSFHLSAFSWFCSPDEFQKILFEICTVSSQFLYFYSRKKSLIIIFIIIWKGSLPKPWKKRWTVTVLETIPWIFQSLKFVILRRYLRL